MKKHASLFAHRFATATIGYFDSRSAERWHGGPVQFLKRDIEATGGEPRQGSRPWAKLTALPLALDLDAAISPGRKPIPAGTKYRFDGAEHAGLAL